MPRRPSSVSETTLSVAVTGHAEGRLLRPTLRSVAAAIEVVVTGGAACELLIVLDNPSDETRREAERWIDSTRISAPVRVILTSAGDVAATRNASARHATGEFLAFCDGDDLVSRNYLSTALALLREAPAPIIVHPALVISFGARAAWWEIPESEAINHLDLVRNNLWPSSSVSRRTTYLEHPYRELPPAEGFGPEDWLWNIETSIAGIAHRPAPDSVFFYRVRERGGVNNRHAHSILPPFDLDALREALPIAPVSTEALASVPPRRPDRGSLAGRAYRRARPLIRFSTRWMSQGLRERLYQTARAALGRVDVAGTPTSMRRISPGLHTALSDATQIEPAISWTATEIRDVPVWMPARDVYASVLLELVEALRENASALVAVPWVGIGGADLVSINYARGLHEIERFDGRVAMLATYLPSRTLRHLVPEGVTFVQIPEVWRTLHPDLQRRLLAQVIVLAAPEVVFSVNCFDVTNSLQQYGQQLGLTTQIFLTLFAFDRIGAGYPTNPITDDSQRDYLDQITAVLTDNNVTRRLIEETLALDDDKVHVHYQPALSATPERRRGTRAYNNSFFNDDNPFLLLWPHRLDKEKRPDALVAIATRLREEAIPARIHVYGSQVLSADGETLMSSLEAAGIEYRGPYQGGLPSLATEDYHALLLTSESEGLPLVLVQSMLLGLPVIATGVGGVIDIVQDGRTGLLVRSPEDVDGFIVAIRRLIDSRDERRRLIDAAYDFAVEQHSWESFIHRLDRALR